MSVPGWGTPVAALGEPFGALFDFVFPQRCAGCDLPGALMCDRCRGEVRLIDPVSACPRCGAPEASMRCAECSDRAFAFSAARCAARLEHPVSRAIVALKDGGERRYARLLAGLLARAAGGWLGTGDVLVPVPASPAALRRRGFDHAADIARELGALADVPVTRVLASGRGADQRTLGRQERFANRRGAFVLQPGIDVPERVVLVDDVLTTGATLDAAAHVLIEAGARNVRSLAVARSCRRDACRSVSAGIHSEEAADD